MAAGDGLGALQDQSPGLGPQSLAAEPYAGEAREPKEEQASGSGHGAETSSEEGPDGPDDGFDDACAKVLEGYASVPSCVPVWAGYLDLFGNVWACLVGGTGWAELSVVSEGADGRPHTTVSRFDAQGLRELAGDAP